jgi:hypothetical protein
VYPALHLHVEEARDLEHQQDLLDEGAGEGRHV